MRSVPGELANGGLMIKAVVIRTWLPTDPEHPGYAVRMANYGDVDALGRIVPTPVQQYLPGELRAVLCDVQPFGYGFRSPPLSMVPVMQPHGSKDDSDRWIPRASTRAVNAGSAVLGGSADRAPQNFLTAPGDLDGEIVIIGFLYNNLACPVVLGSLEHPQLQEAAPTWRLPSALQGPASVRTIRHRGTKVIWDSDGNLTIDATSASTGVVSDSGVDQPSNVGGTIRVIAGPTHKVRVEGGTAGVELAVGTAVADRPIARGPAGMVAGDPTISAFGAAPAGPNPIWYAWFTALAVGLDALFGALGFPVAPVGYPTWVAATAAMLNAGISGTITGGNPDVRTDS